MKHLLLPLLVFLFASAPALAETVPLRASYVVRWTGLEVGRFDAELRRDGPHYHIAYQARAAGPLRWVVDLRSDGWASGRIAGGIVQPEHFRGQSAWRDEARFWRVAFTAAGAVAALELDPASREDREPVPRALQRGPDPLSLALQAMLDAAAGRTLEGQSFDGRRAVRADLACAADPAAIVPAGLGRTRHEALVCEARGELVAGHSKRWRDDDDATERDRRPAKVWLVPEVGGLPHWPVRIELESRWGGLVIELESLDAAPA